MLDHSLVTQSRPARRPDHVLFFAAVPPPEIKDQLAQAWQTMGTGEPFRYNTLHLSIYSVAGADHLDPMLVQRARQAANGMRTAPFTLRLDRLATFQGSSGNLPLVMTMEGKSHKLNEIAADLHSACRKASLPGSRSTKPTPHVTLAYGHGFPEARLLTTPILWTIEEVMLIDSLQGQSRHVSLGRWPLSEGKQQPGFDF